MNPKILLSNRFLSSVLCASVLCFSYQTAQAQFIGGVGATPETSSGTEGVGAGTLGSNLGATIEPPLVLGSSAGVGAGAAAGTAAVGGLSTTAAVALGVVAAAAVAVALSSSNGSGSGTTGTK